MITMHDEMRDGEEGQGRERGVRSLQRDRRLPPDTSPII